MKSGSNFEGRRALSDARIDLVVLGEPVGKARARTIRLKGSGRTVSYTPDKTAHAEAMVRETFAASQAKPFAPDTPLFVVVTAYFNRPKSAPKSRLYPIGRPDWDNVGKLVTDALSGLAYDDDSRIVATYVFKRYAIYPEPPRLVISIGRKEAP